jgi:hypothetical protein
MRHVQRGQRCCPSSHADPAVSHSVTIGSSRVTQSADSLAPERQGDAAERGNGVALTLGPGPAEGRPPGAGGHRRLAATLAGRHRSARAASLLILSRSSARRWAGLGWGYVRARIRAVAETTGWRRRSGRTSSGESTTGDLHRRHRWADQPARMTKCSQIATGGSPRWRRVRAAGTTAAPDRVTRFPVTRMPSAKPETHARPRPGNTHDLRVTSGHTDRESSCRPTPPTVRTGRRARKQPPSRSRPGPPSRGPERVAHLGHRCRPPLARMLRATGAIAGGPDTGRRALGSREPDGAGVAAGTIYEGAPGIPHIPGIRSRSASSVAADQNE